MKILIKDLQKQQKTVEGEDMELDGEIIKIGALTPEEEAEMIKEGKELGNQKITVNGKETKLLDIESGKKLFTITEVKQFDGNYSGFWYVWRNKKIMKRWNKLSEKAQKDLLVILKKKGLDKYLKEL